MISMTTIDKGKFKEIYLSNPEAAVNAGLTYQRSANNDLLSTIGAWL